MLQTTACGVLIKSEPELIIDDDHFAKKHNEAKASEFHRFDPSHIYTCYYCQVEFGTGDEYLRHAIKRHTINAYNKVKIEIDVLKFTCNFCPKAFDSVIYWRKHERENHIMAKSYICDICDAHYPHKYRLIVHMRIHTGERPFRCDICDKKFRSATGKRIHMRVHNYETKYSCPICGKSFRRQSNKNHHLTTHDQNRERPFECNECDRRFFNAVGLKRHKIVHTHKRCHFCEYCREAFTTLYHLQLHTKKRTVDGKCVQVKIFKCEFCEKAFRRQNLRDDHRRIHTGEKPFRCTQCDKTFHSNSKLYQHKRCHSDIKPFSCDHCGKKFNNRQSCRRHERTHTIEYPSSV